jgi:hypothetical protein
MIDTPEPDAAAGESLPPSERPRPKRGAFPTPTSEVDKARPYRPEITEVCDRSGMSPDPPTGADKEKEG